MTKTATHYPLFEFSDHSGPILVFGCDGQIGRALRLCLRDIKESVFFIGRSECDLSCPTTINDVLNRYQPQIIINAAAYTAVDKAESEPKSAFAINAKAPELMARYIAKVTHGILVHYSSDYVFADTRQDYYCESDLEGPIEKLNIYGQSKLAGERAIQEVFSIKHVLNHADNHPRYFILRTSWVYGDGNNFIRKILRVASEQYQLKVVADQFGVPTSAQWLAEVGIKIAESGIESGTYHVVPDGEVSWHGLAVFAIETATGCGEGIKVKSQNILPIPASEYPVPAKRPYNSRLSNLKLKKFLSEIGFTGKYPHWQKQVELYVNDYVKTSLKS